MKLCQFFSEYDSECTHCRIRAMVRKREGGMIVDPPAGSASSEDTLLKSCQTLIDMRFESSSSLSSARSGNVGRNVKRQTLLDNYYHRISQATANGKAIRPRLLDLPLSIRCRIYRSSGLSSINDFPKRVCSFCYTYSNDRGICPIRLNFMPTKWKSQRYDVCCTQTTHLSARTFTCTDCEKYSFERCSIHHAPPTQLLLVCKQIYRETLPILYGENAFEMGYDQVGAFNTLACMSPEALRCLRYLTIRLHRCRCLGPCCTVHADRKKSSDIYNGGQPTISESNIKHRVQQTVPHCLDCLVLQLTQTFEYAHKWFRTGEVNLQLYINASCPETVCRSLETLKSLYGTLNSAVVFMSGIENPDQALRSLVKITGQRLLYKKEITPASSSQVFSRLPSEVLQRILSYTDLVPPHAIVYDEHRGLRPQECCRTCTWSSHDPCACGVDLWTCSSICSCWRVPTSLFLINRHSHEVAVNVFFGQNLFVWTNRDMFSRDDTYWHTVDYDVSLSNTRFGLGYDLSPRYRKQIRHLQIHFPIAHKCQLMRGGARLTPTSVFDRKAVNGLRRLVEAVAQHLYSPDLLLILDLMYPLTMGYGSEGRELDGHSIYGDLPKHLLSCDYDECLYERLIKGAFLNSPAPLSEPSSTSDTSQLTKTRSPLLSDLRDLSIHTSRPSPQDEERHAFEQKLEQMVLGSSYDSSTRGKAKFELTRQGSTKIGQRQTSLPYQLWHMWG